MSLEQFGVFKGEISDDDFIDLSDYEEYDLNEFNDGDEITGKPFTTLYENEEEYKSDSMRFYLVGYDDNGQPIKVKFYCSVPKPVSYSPDGYPLVNLFRNNKYDANTFNVIFSILKLQGVENIYNKDGKPRNSLKNVSAKAYLDILSEQDEITIRVLENDSDYNSLEIVSVK